VPLLRPSWRSTTMLLITGGAGVAVIIALAVWGVVQANTAILLAVGVGIVANTLLIVRLTRRLDRLRLTVDRHAKADADAAAAARGDLQAAADHFREDLAGVRAETLEVLKESAAAKNEIQRIRARTLPELAKRITAQGRDDYEQQVAWNELRNFLDPAPFMPALRGWAASPDVLRVLVRVIDDRRPGLVVECGSGASSVWLGYALRQAGGGRLVALEHDERYAALSRRLVAEHGLEDLIEVRDAPLQEWKVEGRPWYDTSCVNDLVDIDLVFVDGPPAKTCPQARYPALPVLLPRCGPQAVVVLDDANREDEKQVTDRWLAEFPDMQAHEEPTEKGARVFMRRPA
jgi:predicted O-methyltransferase YrrM